MGIIPPRLVHGAIVCSLALGACTSNDAASDATSVTVSSTDDACEVDIDTAPSGDIVFEVTNNGSAVTEFYLYDEVGERIYGEVENIGPGLTRNLTVDADAGEYLTACKPGMIGDGIRAPFTVTDS